jgi:CheY-like chemotaxis protein
VTTVPKTILVVDDDGGLQETLAMPLEGEGCAMLVARDGAEALARLEAARPSVILFDVMMPRMNGYELSEGLTRRGPRPAIRVMVLTADGRARQKAEQIGADSYLSNPFDIPDLLAKLERLA